MRNDATAVATTVSDARDAPAARAVPRWWQLMLLYPSLVATLLAVVPVWMDHIQAAYLGVNTRDLVQAKEQNRLWQTNRECPRTEEIQRIRTGRDMEIGAQVCPSGDVLLLVNRPGAGRITYRWVSARTLERDVLLLLQPAEVNAEAREMRVARLAQRVLDQRWLQPGMLNQRVRQSDGACADLVINTYTGSARSLGPVACTAR